jgi:hypothetical protein
MVLQCRLLNVAVDWHFCFVFWGFRVEISAQRPSILTQVFRSFPQSVKGNTGIMPQIRPWPLPSTFFPIHYSLIIPSYDAVQSEILTALVNKPFIYSLSWVLYTEDCVLPVPGSCGPQLWYDWLSLMALFSCHTDFILTTRNLPYPSLFPLITY